MAVGDCFGEVEQSAAAALGVVSEEVEGLSFVGSVDGHEDAFGALDGGAAGEGSFEVVVFGEAAEDDVEGGLQLL